MDVQPSGLREGSAQCRDGQGARQGRSQAPLRLLGKSAASWASPPAPSRQPGTSRGIHARGCPLYLCGRWWWLPTSAGRAEPVCTRVESKAMGGWPGAVRASTRDCGVGLRAEHRPKDCGNSGGGDRGLWLRGAGSGLGDGRGLHWLWTCQDERAEVLGGWGVGYWQADRRRLGPGLSDRGLLRGGGCGWAAEIGNPHSEVRPKPQ